MFRTTVVCSDLSQIYMSFQICVYIYLRLFRSVYFSLLRSTYRSLFRSISYSVQILDQSVCSDLSILVYSDQSESVRICLSLFRTTSVCSDMSQSVQIYLRYLSFQIYLYISFFRSIYSSWSFQICPFQSATIDLSVCSDLSCSVHILDISKIYIYIYRSEYLELLQSVQIYLSRFGYIYLRYIYLRSERSESFIYICISIFNM